MPADDTPAGDLDEAERLVRQFAETGQHPGRPAVAAVLAEYDRRAQEIEQLAYERDGALARVAAAEAVQSRMADSLPDQGPWELWGHRDRAVRDHEGELSDALSVEETAAPAPIDWAQVATRVARERGSLKTQVAAVRALADKAERERFPLYGGIERAPGSVASADLLAVLDGPAEAPAEVVRQDDTETTRTTSGDQRHDVYVRISDNPVSRTREVFDGLNVDFDSSGAAVGVEVLGSPYRGVTVDGLWAAPVEGVEYVNPSCIECGGEGGPCCEHPDLIGTASPEAQAAWLAGPAEAAEPAPDLYEPGAPLCGCNECEQVRQDTGVEELTDQLRAFHRKAAGSATTTPADDPADEPCRADEGMTGIRCMLDEGHPLPHRGWWRDKNDSAGEYAVYIEWPVPERVSGIRVVPKSGPVSTTPDPATLAPSHLAEMAQTIEEAIEHTHSFDGLGDHEDWLLETARRLRRAALAGNTEETP